MIGRALQQIDRENGAVEVVIAPADIFINKDDVLRTLGYPAGRIDKHFGKTIDDVLARLPGLCDPKAGYGVIDVRFKKGRSDGFFAGENFFTTDRIVARQLRHAEYAALFVCTIGPGMETWSRQSFHDNDPVLGHFIDTVASMAVEQAVGILHDHIGHVMAERDMKITNRFSPGYCGWPVAEQQQLFSCFPDGFCGISLTESSLMVPVKSVSGIIGIGIDVDRKDYICDRCSRKECSYRTYKLARSRKEKRS